MFGAWYDSAVLIEPLIFFRLKHSSSLFIGLFCLSFLLPLKYTLDKTEDDNLRNVLDKQYEGYQDIHPH